MAEHHAKPIDQNNPAVDAAVAMLAVVLPFAVLIFVGLISLAKLPLLGASDGGHADDHAPAAPAAP